MESSAQSRDVNYVTFRFATKPRVWVRWRAGAHILINTSNRIWSSSHYSSKIRNTPEAINCLSKCDYWVFGIVLSETISTRCKQRLWWASGQKCDSRRLCISGNYTWHKGVDVLLRVNHHLLASRNKHAQRASITAPTLPSSAPPANRRENEPRHDSPPDLLDEQNNVMSKLQETFTKGSRSKKARCVAVYFKLKTGISFFKCARWCQDFCSTETQRRL